MIAYMRYAASGASARSNFSIACLVGEIVCSPCSPYQSARAGSITRTIDLLDAEALLGDLGDHEVGVVAGGGGDEHVGALDPGLDQGVGLERGADRELASGVLPGLALAGVEALVRERIGVEHRHLVAGRERGLGDGRADAPGADDQNEHAAEQAEDT